VVNTTIPVLTLVIKSIIDDCVNEYNRDDKVLIRTLSMLCSFNSVEDFCSFIYSKKFNNLVNEDVWVVFELGSYKYHEKTLELTATLEEVVLIDKLETGCFKDGFVRCKSKKVLFDSINSWLSLVLID
tara:strand:- start:607 stop:990 length:384 start_codon:yes stop_codon:yes gene_type:complete